MSRSKPVVLLILDGWGESPAHAGNAITTAKTPCWDHLMKTCPHTLISGSGEDVGLPDGQMGNSEVGHLTMGAGRVVYQDLTLITKQIQNKEFFANPVLLAACQKAKAQNKAIHVMGLVSPGGVHSHEDHLLALLDLAQQQQVPSLYVHAFLDGRDTPPKSAMDSLERLQQRLTTTPYQIATVSGRYYAMDRDKRWERVQLAYDAIVQRRSGYTATSATQALEAAYARDESDEFVQPTLIENSKSTPMINDGDIVIYFNFRADRARALCYALTQPDFTGFERPRLPKIELVTFTQYDIQIQSQVVYPPMSHKNTLGEYLQSLNLTQLRLAETEKYAHVTFFFNGGIEQPYQGEIRKLVPSPKVATYDLKPEMSAAEVTDILVENILNQSVDFIVCNFANADMVGHTGNMPATITAIETLDRCLARITTALKQVQGLALITSDHGNAECMIDEENEQAHTAHTTSLVPLVYIGHVPFDFIAKPGRLSDIAPTLLTMMDLKIPNEMTGTPLLTRK
jgi:2,3-bisphosphoglycerate-independent phosphoglycerate mutase